MDIFTLLIQFTVTSLDLKKICFQNIPGKNKRKIIAFNISVTSKIDCLC